MFLNFIALDQPCSCVNEFDLKDKPDRLFIQLLP